MSKVKKIDSLNPSFPKTSDEEFIESFSSKKRRRQKDDVLDLTYLNEEVKNVFIYPLTTLTGKTVTEGIRISNEKTTILATTPDKGKKVKVYLEQNENYSLNEFTDPANPTEQLIKNSNTFNLTTIDFSEVNFNLLYLLTFEELTAKNINSIKQYIGQTISQNSDNQQVDMTFTPIDEFSSLFQSQPIKIVISEPILGKIKEIHVTSPVGTLISKIKAIDTDGHQADLLAKEGTEIFPKLVFPFQTQPHLATAEYWASKQIIPLKEIFDFLDSKNINYSDEFSLSEFLNLGQKTDYPPLQVDHANEISWDEKGKVDDGKWVGLGTGAYTWNPKEPKDYSKNMKVTIGTKRWNSTSTAPNGVQTQDLYETVSEINNVHVTPTNVGKSSEAFKAVCLMLTETFWKDMEFKEATKIEIKNGQRFEAINDAKIYKLREKYSGQDRYSVTTNVWIAWKRQNPDLVNANPNIIRRIENALAMLSGVIKSNFNINKGANDDYQILLPYYFEIQNKLDNPASFVEYNDINVKLKSRYGEFTENGFNFTDKNIARTKIFELEYNHFVFPELTKKVETASIPSSMPLDQELANGEFSKYMMQNFAKETSKKKLYLERYGSGKMNYDPLNSSLENDGEFEFNKSINVSEIEISAFYGFGKWKFNFLTDEGKKFELDLSLFDKYINTQTLVDLIL